MQFKFFTLTNGLRIVLIDTGAFPTLTALLLVGTGSRYENKKNNGIAHFFEHMVFKGSKKYPSALKISTILDGLGSENNAFTTKDYTGYWIKSPSKHFPILVDILSEMVLNPLLLEKEIKREKGVIIEEINMYEDTPQYKVWDLFEGLLYPNNPLGYDTIGKKETVGRFSRQTFLDYVNRYYQPNNAILVVAGGLLQNQNDKLKLENYLEIIEKKFKNWGKRKLNMFNKFYEKQTKPAVLIHHKKTEQAHLVLGFHGLARGDKNRYVQTVLMTVLGGGMSSRLFYEVRERRGLCYYIQSGGESFAETGYVYTRAGLNLDLNKVKEAMKIIFNEHQKISQGRLTDEETNKAKEMLKGRLLLSLEDSNNLATFVGKRLLLENKLEPPEEIIKKIDQVTKNQMVNLAKKLFVKSELNLAVIGPFQQDSFKGI